MGSRKVFYTFFGLGCFALVIILWEQRFECQFFQVFRLSYLQDQYCPPPQPIQINLPAPPDIGFNYANAQMSPSDADAIAANLTSGATSIDQVAADPRFAPTACTYAASGADNLHLSFSGAAPTSPHPLVQFQTIGNGGTLPSPTNPTACQRSFLPQSLNLLRANGIRTLHSSANFGAAEVVFQGNGGGTVTVDASSEINPACGFFQFTLSQYDTNPDGSNNTSGFAGGTFGLLLRDDCPGGSGGGSNPVNVVVISGGNLTAHE